MNVEMLARLKSLEQYLALLCEHFPKMATAAEELAKTRELISRAQAEACS